MSRPYSRTLWWLSCLFFLVLFVLLAVFSHPQRDDYNFAAYTLLKGFWNHQSHLYLHWQGRYFSNLWVSACSVLAISRSWYWVHPLLLLAASTWALGDLLGRCCKWLPTPPDKLTLWLYVTMIQACLILTMPLVAEGFFWLSAAVTYQLGWVLLLLWMGQWIRYLQKGGPVALVLGVVLALALAGCNEWMAMMALLLFVFYLVRRKQKTKADLVMLLAILTGTGFALLSPGSWNRSGTMGGFQWLPALAAILYWPMTAMVAIASKVIFWGVALFFLLLSSGVSPQNTKVRAGDWYILFLLPVLAMLPMLIASGGSLPLRVLNPVTQYWVLIFFAWVWWLGSRHTFIEGTMIKKYVARILPLLLVATFLQAGYPRNVLQGWFYNQLLTANEKELRQHTTITFSGDYAHDIRNWYVNASIPQKEIIWQMVREKPELIGNYEDFEYFNPHSAINLYYRTIGDR